MEEQGITVNKNDLIAPIDNMRSLAKDWRSSIGERDELVFLRDIGRDLSTEGNGNSIL